MAASERLRFEDFEVDVSSFTLARNGEPVAVEPQVLSLLIYLAGNGDRLVAKNELLDELWGHRYVSESALSTQIKSLRKALGDDGRNQRLIKTVHGRGYRFVGEVTSVSAPARSELEVTTAFGDVDTNLGNERLPLFGRETDIERTRRALREARLVSVLGIGGTGKTRLAKAVGRAELERFPDGVWFVDLVPVEDGEGIDIAIAASFGLADATGSSRMQVAEALRERECLMILDNCEHIEEEVARALDFLLGHTRRPVFLATSRDPIDLQDEVRLFLDPLDVSDSEEPAAVRLFRATAQRFGAGAVDAPEAQIRHICQRLDGLPLAIELAAAQLGHLTVDELLHRLDHRFDFLAGRQRDGVERQDNLRTVLEDTWQLLEPEAQQLLGLLSVFPSQFTMQDAEQLAGNRTNIGYTMSRLVELCLLSRTSRRGAWWRLLESVRLFVRERIGVEQMRENQLQHAQWCLTQLGDYPHDHQDDFAHAIWAIEHYDDTLAAEACFEARGDWISAIDVCRAMGLATQLEEGPKTRARYTRIHRYLNSTEDFICQRNLHGIAALCCQVLGDTEGLARHARKGLEMALENADDVVLSGAYIMATVPDCFSDPTAALEKAMRAAELGRRVNNQVIVDSANAVRGWVIAMGRGYEEACELTLEIAERNIDMRFDNPTYNAVCVVVTSTLFDRTELAVHWTDRLMLRPEGQLLWMAQAVMASAYALGARWEESLKLATAVAERLDRAGRRELPDLLVMYATLAHASGDDELARRWLAPLRAERLMLHTFHLISIYRQLRDRVSRELPEQVPSLSAAHQEALQWVVQRRREFD